MPYININITNKLNEEEKNTLKSKLGELITIIPGKTEARLMIGINDDYSLYHAGDKKEKAAYIIVQLFKSCDFEYKAKFTEKVFDFLEEEFNIPKANVYLSINEHQCWGSNGTLNK
ncbi:Macrophage migration inhibitory factor (MIF) [Clostridium collagenovorans DSM 3089]|uniref:Macrophage migration inhibitory factor (MIF) n=1 Tax=Clostridium collagenovorans DSM 3089 TaxID=1121306 RepID=A0A1M5VBP1_9CLOT|nr:phenylpyruvate tautomerase MIF-related protein [Clostridium collagenovorans]SHH72660.1 Macrophage migration inhibitory factor (MIF) [Clostridium collagenovorans DSM 3089]